jgi:hypothetical protein
VTNSSFSAVTFSNRAAVSGGRMPVYAASGFGDDASETSVT